MAAPKGNKFWMARSKHGRDKLFSGDPEVLWEACQEYFQYVEDHPLQEEKLFSFQGEITRGTVYKMQAMTIDGLCLFLDITQQTWFTWRDDKDFSEVVAKAERVIRHQKFTGAAADQLNPNIIARDLGLRDNHAVEHSGHVSYEKMDDAELDRVITELEQKLEESRVQH